MIKCYVGLFNKILDTGMYPEAWTVGLIIPIYKKKGDRMDSNNYRGVTAKLHWKTLYICIK